MPPEIQSHQKAIRTREAVTRRKAADPFREKGKENMSNQKGWESVILNWDEGQLEGKGSLRTKTKQEKRKGQETHRSVNSETRQRTHVTTW